jgi:autotransporter-associated beta strand protein
LSLRQAGIACSSVFIALTLTAPALHAGQIWDGGSTGPGDDNWNTAANWDGDALPTFTNAISFTGDTRNTPTNDLAANSLIGGILFTNDGSAGKTNAFTLSGARITLGGDITTTAITAGPSITDVISLDMVLDANRTLTTGNLHNLTISGIISGTGFGFTKAGLGTLTLTNVNNAFTGNITIDGGILAAGTSATASNSVFGTTASLAAKTITINSGGSLRADVGNIFSNNFAAAASALPTLNINGGTMTNGGTATNSALGNITLAGGTLDATTGSPAGTASGQGYGSWNLNGTVTSTGTSLISSSAGTGIPVTLNATNGLTSPATIFDVQSGTLTVSAALGQVTRAGNETVGSLTKTGDGTMILSGSNAFTGATTINAGTLTLDYSTNNDSKLADTAALNLGGGTLTLSGGSHTEAVGSTTLLQGKASKITRSSGTSILQMGAITRETGATIDFAAPGIATTTTANTSGILGGWATVNGLDLASNNGSGSIIAYTGYTDVTRLSSGTKVIPNSATANIRLVDGTGSQANITLAATTSVNTILNNSTGTGSATARIEDTTTSRILATSAVIVPSAAGDLYMRIGNSNGGIRPLAAGGELLLNVGTDRTLTIQSTTIRNNNSASSLVKTGGGLVNLFGGNLIMSGAVRIQEGTLFLNGHAAFGGATSYQIAGGATWDLLLNLDTASTTAPITIDTQADNSAILRYGRGGTTAAGTLTLDGAIGGTGNMDFVARSVQNAGTNHVLVLNAASTYTGNTLITSTANNTVLTVRAGVDNALPTTTVLTINGVQGGTPGWVSAYDLNGKNQTLAGLVSPASPDRLNQIQNSAGTASLLTLNNAADYEFAGQITGTNLALTKTGTGTQTLSGDNSYGGLTSISGSGSILRITSGTALGNTTQGVTIASGGALEIDGTGGAVIVGAEAVTMTGGGISNTGAMRNIAGDNTWGGTITTSTGSIRINSDSGTLLLNNASAVTSGGNRNLVIGGEGNVTITGGIALGTGGAQISKDGNGTLTLSGNNTSNHNSNGGLNINAGNVKLGSANALNSTAGSENGVTFGANSTGILSLSGNSVVIRSLNSNATPGTPVVQNADAGNATLTVGNSKNLASTYAGVIQNGSGGGTLGLTKAGTNSLTLSGVNTYTGDTMVSAGTLFATGSLTSDVTVSDAATLGGGGTVGAVSFAGGSFFDIALAIGGNALDSTATISFSSAGFGIDNLVFNGAAVDWSTIVNNTYTLISGNLDETLLDNFGSGSAFGIGGGRTAYFEEGSLNLVVIPEPRAALLGGLGLLALLRRRR